jgi:hypothetical protein
MKTSKRTTSFKQLSPTAGKDKLHIRLRHDLRKYPNPLSSDKYTKNLMVVGPDLYESDSDKASIDSASQLDKEDIMESRKAKWVMCCSLADDLASL